MPLLLMVAMILSFEMTHGNDIKILATTDNASVTTTLVSLK